MSTPQHSVTVRRLIQVERNRVFDAFSSADALSQWFSPSVDISVEFQEFEFAEKGKFRLIYTMQNGSQPTVSGAYEIIDRPNKIVLTWMWEAGDPHANIPTRVIVRFIGRGTDTEVVLTHEELPKQACDRHQTGWEATLDRLAPSLFVIQ